MGVSLNPNARWTHTIATDLVLPVSYCGWVRVDTDRNQFTTICWLGDDTTTDHAVLIALQADGVTPILYDSNFDADITGTAMTVSTWYFVAATAAAGTGNFKLYQVAHGGTLALTDSSTYSGTFDGELIGIGGGRPDGEANAVNADASFAYWRFWTAELSLAELQAEMASTTPVRTTNLWASYRLENTTNHTVDGSGNGRNLTATAGTGSFANTDDPSIGGTPQALAGHASSASSATGTLTVARPLDGHADAATDASGALTVARDLTGTADAAATATGDLNVTRPLDGTAPAAASATGELTVERPLAGSASTATDAAGELTVSRALAGVAAAASSATGTLTGDVPLADLSVLVAPTRLRGVVTAASTRQALTAAATRGGMTAAGSRLREPVASANTRRRDRVAVGDNRTGWDTDDTRTGVTAGPTRIDRED